jgi:hypothetical protein
MRRDHLGPVDNGPDRPAAARGFWVTLTVVKPEPFQRYLKLIARSGAAERGSRECAMPDRQLEYLLGAALGFRNLTRYVTRSVLDTGSSHFDYRFAPANLAWWEIWLGIAIPAASRGRRVSMTPAAMARLGPSPLDRNWITAVDGRQNTATWMTPRDGRVTLRDVRLTVRLERRPIRHTEFEEIVVSPGPSGTVGSSGNGGGAFDGRTWLLGAGSAVLSGVVLLAIQNQQWIWLVVSILAVIVAALCLSLLRSTNKRGAVLGFLAAGVALGLVLTFGVTQLVSGSKRRTTTAAASNSPGAPVHSVHPDPTAPLESGTALKLTIDTPAAMAKIPIGGTVATGVAEGALSPGWTLWFVKFSGGQNFVVDQIALTAGQWSVGTGQIGSNDPQEVGGVFALQVVMATPEASTAMKSAAAKADDGIAALPTGTTILAQRPIVRA